MSARGYWEYDFNLRLATRIEQDLLHAGFGKTVLLVTDGPTRKGLAERVARANALSPDLFLSIHHDSVPDSFLERWQYEGEDHYFSDRFKGHSIFVSNDNADANGSLLFGHLMGEQLRARGLHYTPHYIEKFMGHRQRLLVDVKAGVYRYDQLIVLRTTQMPAVLLEAGSIINRDEELLMSSPEHQSAHQRGGDRRGRKLLRGATPAPSGSRPRHRRCQAGVLRSARLPKRRFLPNLGEPRMPQPEAARRPPAYLPQVPAKWGRFSQ